MKTIKEVIANKTGWTIGSFQVTLTLPNGREGKDGFFYCISSSEHLYLFLVREVMEKIDVIYLHKTDVRDLIRAIDSMP